MTYLEIQADDTARAVGFYRDLLGWTIDRDENVPIEYWRIHGADVAGGILPRPAPAPAPEQGTNAFVVSFEVADFDAAASKVGELGGQVALEKFAVPGRCWQGYFIDTEGNTFGLFEPDTAAA